MSDDVRYGKSPVTGNWYKVTDYEEVEGDPNRIIANEKIEVDAADVPEKVKRAHEIVEDSGQVSQSAGDEQ